MKTNRNCRLLRTNLKDLLQGYIEHCEVSPHLMAKIDLPIIYHGFRFGAPVFTHSGPCTDHTDREIIGLIGRNTPESSIASDVLLQFIEILSQQPHLAGPAVLRILPVANPVALELGDSAPPAEGWPILHHLLTRFQDEAADGVIEILPSSDAGYLLEGSANSSVFAALRDVVDGAGPETSRPRVLVPPRISISPIAADLKWNLRLHVPMTWNEAPEIHAIARFLSRLLHLLSLTPRSGDKERNRF
jgi:hypothetical protein